VRTPTSGSHTEAYRSAWVGLMERTITTRELVYER
jgi:hypothetical protein